MIDLVMLALVQTIGTPTTPPTDWSTVPELTLRARGDAGTRVAFVSGEVAAGRCQARQTADGHVGIDAPVVVLFDAQRRVRQIVPRAIGCPTVEQYTVGYVSTLIRDAEPVQNAGWYRVTVTYQWAR